MNAKENIKVVLFDIIQHELKTNNQDEINIMLLAIKSKIDDYDSIVEAVAAQVEALADYDTIKDVCYDVIF